MQFVLIGFVALIATVLVSYTRASRAPTQEPCGYLPPNQPSRQQIHAGYVVEAGQWPWLAFISQTYLGYPLKFCAGAIIDREWILTAAHCLRPLDKASDYCVVVGRHNISNLDDKNCAPLGQRPLQVIPHPIFNQAALKNTDIYKLSDQQKHIMYHDIGLIKMAPMSFATADVGRICLPTEAGNYYDQSCHVAGWGSTKTRKKSNHLKSFRSQIWSESDCQTKSYYGVFGLTDKLYCVGDSNANICNGDSGAPLFCKRSNGQYEVVGVASSGG